MAPRTLLGLCFRSIGLNLGASWDTIKEIQKEYLSNHFGKPELKDITKIAIDEISIGKAHKYITLVLGLDTGAVVFIGDGKGADRLDLLWEKLKKKQSLYYRRGDRHVASLYPGCQKQCTQSHNRV